MGRRGKGVVGFESGNGEDSKNEKHLYIFSVQ